MRTTTCSGRRSARRTRSWPPVSGGCAGECQGRAAWTAPGRSSCGAPAAPAGSVRQAGRRAASPAGSSCSATRRATMSATAGRAASTRRRQPLAQAHLADPHAHHDGLRGTPVELPGQGDAGSPGRRGGTRRPAGARQPRATSRPAPAPRPRRQSPRARRSTAPSRCLPASPWSRPAGRPARRGSGRSASSGVSWCRATTATSARRGSPARRRAACQPTPSSVRSALPYPMTSTRAGAGGPTSRPAGRHARRRPSRCEPRQRASSSSTFPSGASSWICSAIWPRAWVEQERHGS